MVQPKGCTRGDQSAERVQKKFNKTYEQNDPTAGSTTGTNGLFCVKRETNSDAVDAYVIQTKL